MEASRRRLGGSRGLPIGRENVGAHARSIPAVERTPNERSPPNDPGSTQQCLRNEHAYAAHTGARDRERGLERSEVTCGFGNKTRFRTDLGKLAGVHYRQVVA